MPEGVHRRLVPQKRFGFKGKRVCACAVAILAYVHTAALAVAVIEQAEDGARHLGPLLLAFFESRDDCGRVAAAISESEEFGFLPTTLAKLVH